MNAAVPARYRRNLSEAASAGVGMSQPAHISLEMNRFTLVDAAGNQRPVPTLHLDCIVVDANNSMSKVYYATGYTGSDEGQPPTCWSDNGIGPSSQSASPQSPTCASCPHNVWGSAISQMTGKQVKACRDYKKLAVILPDDPQAIIWQLRVPPASAKALATYARSLAAHNINGRSADLCDAITRISFVSQGVIDFVPVGQINENHGQILDRIAESNASDAVVGRNDTAYQGQIAAPAPVQALPPAVAPPPPVQQWGPPPQQLAAQQASYNAQPPQGAFQAPVQQWTPPPQQVFQPSPSPVQQWAPPTAPPGMVAFPAQQTFQPAAPVAPPAPNGFAAPAPAAPRTRRARTPAAPPAPVQAPPVDPRQGTFADFAPPAAMQTKPFSQNDIPAFLRKPEAPPQQAPQFGMQQAAPAPDAMQAALDAAFKV